jgi:hypothetical protein
MIALALLTRSAAAQDTGSILEEWMAPPEIHEWHVVSEMPGRRSFSELSDICEQIAETETDASVRGLSFSAKAAIIDYAYKGCMAMNGYVYVRIPITEKDCPGLAVMLTTSAAAAQDTSRKIPPPLEPWTPPPEIVEWHVVSEMPGRFFSKTSDTCEQIAENAPDASVPGLSFSAKAAIIDYAHKNCMAKSGYVYVRIPATEKNCPGFFDVLRKSQQLK